MGMGWGLERGRNRDTYRDIGRRDEDMVRNNDRGRIKGLI